MQRRWNSTTGIPKRKVETREGNVIEIADVRALGCPNHIAARIETLNGYTPVDGHRSAPAGKVEQRDLAIDAMRARLAAQSQIHVA